MEASNADYLPDLFPKVAKLSQKKTFFIFLADFGPHLDLRFG